MTLATPAFAQTPAFERDVLRSIDTMPTRAQLDENFEDARGQIEAAALDDKLDMWIRDRAITLLSFYPDARTRAFLEKLLEDANHNVRRMAVYTLGRSFGTQADAALVAKLAAVIETDPHDKVVQWAVRSLRWVHHDEATRLLKTLASVDDLKGRIAALALKRSTYEKSSPQ